MGKLIDLTGCRFGRLTVVRHVGMTGHNTFWHCVCDCGNEVDVASHKLRTGHTRSCGCLHNEMLSMRNSKHCLTNSRLYAVYASMKSRCYNERSHEYASYGGRGIRVCEEWRDDFKAFYEWAVSSGYESDVPRGTCTLDRIDNDGDYRPDNCRWINIKQQNRRRKEVEATYADGTTKRFWSVRAAGEATGTDRKKISSACVSGDILNGASWRACKTLKLLDDPTLYTLGVVVPCRTQ